MSSVWMTCCQAQDYPLLLDEVGRRDSSARLLRFGDVASLGIMVDAFPDAACSAAIYARRHEVDGVVQAVSGLVGSGRARRVVVVVDEADPGDIARLFYAGAQEVIAASDVERDSDRSANVDDKRGAVGSSEGADHAAAVHHRNDAGARWAPPEPADSGSYRRAVGLEGPNGGPIASTTAEIPLRSMSGERLRQDASTAGDAAYGTACEGTSGGGDRQPPAANMAAGMPRAPIVTVLSGRGGAGKTTLVASLGCAAARMGLRVALVDLDLMFGNLYELLGVDVPDDLGRLIQALEEGRPSGSFESAVESCAMRIGPGLTLWGPLDIAERAELMAPSLERLLELLRGVADIVFVDTSVFWGDAVAAAVAMSGRCLIVGGSGASSDSARRAVRLASRIGIPQTRMTSVLMGMRGREEGEEPALRFEMATALRSKARVSDGGEEVRGIRSFARLDALVGEDVPFARDVRELTERLLSELGCAVQVPASPQAVRERGERQRIRLPWKQKTGDRP